MGVELLPGLLVVAVRVDDVLDVAWQGFRSELGEPFEGFLRDS